MQKGPQRRPQGTPRDAPGPPKGPRRSPQGCPSGPQASQLVLWCRRNAHYSEKRAFRLHESTSQPPWGRQRGPLGTPVGHQIASLGGVPQGSRVNSKEKKPPIAGHIGSQKWRKAWPCVRNALSRHKPKKHDIAKHSPLCIESFLRSQKGSNLGF